MWAYIVTLAFTLYMTGVIWGMQVLEYPLFALVGPQEFPAYYARHNHGLPLVVIGPSLIACVSAVILAVIQPPLIPLWSSIILCVCDLAIIGITIGREAPLHARLDRKGYQQPVIHRLILGNCARTILWTINAVIGLGVAVMLLFAV